MSEDINQAILAELRQIRSICRQLFLSLVVAGSLGILSVVFSHATKQPSSGHSWEHVNAYMRQQEFHRALSEAQLLVTQEPNYYYGHAYLGAIYLAVGDLTNAATQYSSAYELFPNEQSEKDLAAVRKRLIGGNGGALLSK